VEGAKTRGRPKRIWRDVEQKDCEVCKLNRVMLWFIVDEGSR